MNIAIIGGSYFIGSRLCNRLNNHTEAYKIIDKKNSPFFQDKVTLADIRNRDYITKALSGTNAVIHLVAEHRDDVTPKSLYDDVNVTCHLPFASLYRYEFMVTKLEEFRL